MGATAPCLTPCPPPMICIEHIKFDGKNSTGNDGFILKSVVSDNIMHGFIIEDHNVIIIKEGQLDDMHMM